MAQFLPMQMMTLKASLALFICKDATLCSPHEFQFSYEFGLAVSKEKFNFFTNSHFLGI